MSAAEKLKALEADTRRMSAGHGHAFVPHSLIDALPQIVAVVEAAERLADSTDDDWFYSGGRAQTMRVLAALDAALTAGGKE